jgi:hypothetical protein
MLGVGVRARTLCALALLALAALPARALADRDAEVAIMDDQLLLTNKRGQVNGAMYVFQRLGVDRVRVSAFWRDIAPKPLATRRPRGFHGENPRAKGYRWRLLDRVVRAANARGIKLMLSITTPAPIWASESPRRKNPLWRPKPAEFARFAKAVATRYAARVDMYSILNEPNQGAWLQPQSLGRRLVAPHLYRALVNAAYPAIKEADPDATVLVGELAPGGRDDRGVTRPIRPLAFLRAFGCVNDNFGPLRSGPCKGFQPAPADMIATHPYQVKGDPSQHSRSPDDAAIGDADRLFATLDNLVAAGGIRSLQKPQLDVYYTEFGYQTKPPDPYSGISLKRQDLYLQQAAFIAWNTPRVRGFTQFRLSDGALIPHKRGRVRYGEIQSGLLFASYKPKPSYYNFFDPFWIDTPDGPPPQGSPVRFWGQVRPGAEQAVTIEYRPSRDQPWSDVDSFTTDQLGYFERFLPAATGEYRFRWEHGISATRLLAVSQPAPPPAPAG